MKLYHSSFKIFLSFFNNPDINNIAGNKHWHKYNKIIHPGECISFSTDISNPNFFQQWQFFSSSHLFYLSDL